MEFVPGPDLPTGGIIVGLDGIKDAYTNGTRHVPHPREGCRSNRWARVAPAWSSPSCPTWSARSGSSRRSKTAVNAKKLTGISDVTDLTDRNNGLRLIIGIKTGFDPQAVLDQLYRLTPLEDSFGINNVALVDGQPKTLGLRELLRVYIDHRIEVVTRRSRFRLGKKQDRLHLVEGLLIAILDIDEVIQVIRASDDGEQARARLMDVFDLSQAQSEYILELRLRRLTKFSRIELEAERDALKAEIAELIELLGSTVLLHAQVARELEAAAEAYGTPRRTMLLNGGPVVPRSAKAAAAADLQIGRCALSGLPLGHRVAWCAPSSSPTPPTAGIVPPSRRSKHDAIRSSVDSTTRGDLGAVTSKGRLVRFTPVDLPVGAGELRAARGGHARRPVPGARRRRARRRGSLAGGGPAARSRYRARCGEAGWPRPRSRTSPTSRSSRSSPATASSGQRPHPDGAELVFVAADAQLLRFDAASVRPQGRSAGGMAGIRLSSGVEAEVAFAVVPPEAADAVVVTIAGDSTALAGTDAGSAKVSAFTEYPSKGRATGGVRAQRFLRGEDALTLAWVGEDPRAVGADGAARVLPDSGAKRDASGTPLDGAVGAVGTAVR